MKSQFIEGRRKLIDNDDILTKSNEICGKSRKKNKKATHFEKKTKWI